MSNSEPDFKPNRRDFVGAVLAIVNQLSAPLEAPVIKAAVALTTKGDALGIGEGIKAIGTCPNFVLSHGHQYFAYTDDVDEANDAAKEARYKETQKNVATAPDTLIQHMNASVASRIEVYDVLSPHMGRMAQFVYSLSTKGKKKNEKSQLEQLLDGDTQQQHKMLQDLGINPQGIDPKMLKVALGYAGQIIRYNTNKHNKQRHWWTDRQQFLQRTFSTAYFNIFTAAETLAPAASEELMSKGFDVLSDTFAKKGMKTDWKKLKPELDKTYRKYMRDLSHPYHEEDRLYLDDQRSRQGMDGVKYFREVDDKTPGR